MTDPIQSAVNLSTAAAAGVAASAATAAVTSVANAIPAGVNDALKKLPLTKDPELLKQMAMAEAQKLVGEAQAKLQNEKETRIEELKSKALVLAPLAAAAVSLYLKLPILDPKILATLAFLKAQQEFRELKQKASKQNLKKAKETFTFPMKPPRSFTDLPKLPSIPQIPDIPTLPNVSRLPNISNR